MSGLSFVSHQIEFFFVKNPMNWPRLKKAWVMFQVCFLTFSVYFGSAVYTAGVRGVAEQYHVSTVAATLGLTLFLLGCGTGKLS
jgi:DHA1 family multidrug resistance protein-like MFS transporter